MTAPRPVWVPAPFLARARWHLLTAVAGLVCLAAPGVLGLLADRLPDDGWAGVLVVLALLGLPVGFALLAVGITRLRRDQGPGDDMSVYGAGRSVTLSWSSRRHERGRVEVEALGAATVTVGERREREDPPAVTVGLDGGGILAVRSGPSTVDPDWYALVDGWGQARAVAHRWRGPGHGGDVAHWRQHPGHADDWEIRPATGPTLRLRHGHLAQPRRVSLVDGRGTAWWVRDRRTAELPGELDAPSAMFVVLVVDLLHEAGRERTDARRQKGV